MCVIFLVTGDFEGYLYEEKKENSDEYIYKRITESLRVNKWETYLIIGKLI